MERGSLTWRSREIISVMRRRACKHFVHAASIWTGQGARELGYRYKPLYSGAKIKKWSGSDFGARDQEKGGGCYETPSAD